VPHRCDAAVLDLGGVLVEIDFGRAFAAWAKAAGVPAGALSGKFSFDEAYCAHERGEIDQAGYFLKLRECLRVDIPDEAMLAGWNAIFGGPLPGAERVVRELAARMPLYVFSNTNPAHVAHFGPRYRELLSPVTKVVTSCDIGRRKPEPEAFRRMAAITGVPPSRLAFFDDLEENVAGARQAGLQARRVTRPQEILDALEGSSVSRPDDRRERS
jgi:putative hydrolase of the HAD superfamily